MTHPAHPVRVSRKEILNAIEWRMNQGEALRDGLCTAFSEGNGGTTLCAGRLEDSLLNLGGVEGGLQCQPYYYWPLSPKGHAQRLMMLAFLLTWQSDRGMRV